VFIVAKSPNRGLRAEVNFHKPLGFKSAELPTKPLRSAYVKFAVQKLTTISGTLYDFFSLYFAEF
jgi:hypothetical protein